MPGITLLSGNPTPVSITPEMLEPVVDSVVANIGVALPIGMTLFGVIIGISVIVRLISRMVRG